MDVKILGEEGERGQTSEKQCGEMIVQVQFLQVYLGQTTRVCDRWNSGKDRP